jgi:hypothetical protein
MVESKLIKKRTHHNELYIKIILIFEYDYIIYIRYEIKSFWAQLLTQLKYEISLLLFFVFITINYLFISFYISNKRLLYFYFSDLLIYLYQYINIIGLLKNNEIVDIYQIFRLDDE